MDAIPKFVRLWLPGYKHPPLNRMLSASHWQRLKLKQEAQAVFVSALSASPYESVMKTGCATSTSSTKCGTRASSKTTKPRSSKSSKSKSKSKPDSKKAR